MKVEDQLALILSKLDEQLKGIFENTRCLHQVHDSVTEITVARAEFDRWRTKVDDQVADLRDCVDNLHQQLDELKSASTTTTTYPAHAGSSSLKVPGSAHLDPSSVQAASGPCGHGAEPHHRSDGSGVVYTLEPPPVNEIRATVLLHRPKDLDTASSLAILQEEVLSGHVPKEYKKLDSSYSSKHTSKTQSMAATFSNKTANSKHSSESAVGNSSVQPDEKLASLMAYRKARGLCFKCGGKWGPQHKCPPNVPLQVIEELWQLLGELAEQSLESDSDPDELMALSDEVIKGICAPHTLKVHAFIQGYNSLVLVDSGSFHNFISEHLAKMCYDAILGIEWLESFSPMQIQWKQKWLSFQYQQTKVKIQGIQGTTDKPQEVTLNQLLAMVKQEAMWGVVELHAVDTTNSNS
ncbi:unnamed protein product [Miscanthus lutarioriparius]|uniref:Uncharacterized protein n=1 Tax=Miscanthus lutarioriparius TaxID=422564 RepID=A0A811PCY6_9POAL|nr:unnamed protein product [Miscanthus lutarioriparius]